MNELAGLHLKSVGIIINLIIWCQTAMVEILILVDPGVVVMCEARSCDARAGGGSRHVVEDSVWTDISLTSEEATKRMWRTSYDFHACRMASINHIGVLSAVATF